MTSKVTIYHFSQFFVWVGLKWVVLLFHVELLSVTHMTALTWALIWEPCWGWNVQHDLSHMSEPLVLTINWGTFVLFH